MGLCLVDFFFFLGYFGSVMSGVISVVLVCLAGWWYLGMSGYSLVGEWMEGDNGMSGYLIPVAL